MFLKVLTIINAPHAPKNKIASLVDEQKVTKTKGFCRNGGRMMNIKSKTREKETMKAGSRGLCWVEVMDDSDAPEVRKGDLLLVDPKTPGRALALVRWY